MLLIQLTAAHGPAECEHAVRLTLKALLREAQAARFALEVIEAAQTPAGYKSVLLRCTGVGADAGAATWIAPWLGTIQWVFTSPLRPHHKRKNWFVAVQRCAMPEVMPADGEIVFQACKASGAGGQHVNTTDSAVHAVHLASGLSIKVSAERSQHANKRLARELIAIKLAQRNTERADAAKQSRNLQHWQVARGAPVKVFRV